MSTAEARRTLDWFRPLVSDFVAAMEPSEFKGDGLCLNWERGGDTEHFAFFNPDGSLLLVARQLWQGGDEGSETIKEFGADGERRVRTFYEWW